MVNPYCGEVELVLDGKAFVLRLTLGALAELEETLAAGSLLALVERFEAGSFTTRDLVALLGAGLKGGGWQGELPDLLNARIEGGPVGAARVAARLLAVSFAVPDAPA
jgi:tail tube GTA-gp10-like protein